MIIVIGQISRYYEQARNQWVAERARLDEVAAGRAEPKCTDEAVASIRQVIHPARLRYERAVRLYVWLFDKEPALADDLAKGHRYAAARCAVLAAVGKDKEMPAVEPAE